MPVDDSSSGTPPAAPSPSDFDPYFPHHLEDNPAPRSESITIPPMSRPEENGHEQNTHHLLRTLRRSSNEHSGSRVGRRRIPIQTASRRLDRDDSPDMDPFHPRRSQNTARRGNIIIEDDLNNVDPALLRTMARNNAIAIGRQQDISQNGTYTDAPVQRSESIYGWAPTDEEMGLVEGDPSPLLEDMWYGRDSGSHPDTSNITRRDSSRASASRPANGESEARRNALRYGLYGGSALATAALLQSVRRHPRFSSRSRALQNYIMDHDREREDQDEELQTASLPAPTAPTARNDRSIPISRGDLRRHSEIRRMYLKDPSIDRLKEAIQYLDRVRFSSSYEESISSAAAGGFIQYEYFRRNEDDFILNTGSISAPPQSSWLQPGAVFSGFQQAKHCSTPPMLSHRIATSNRPTDPVIVNGSENNGINVFTSSGRRYWARNSVDLGRNNPDEPVAPSKTERWPVKVTIHNVDYDTMTLSGTMEAYNIPDKTAENQGAHIVTYLEGEIIDFNTHTLETKNFNAGSEIDSCYWRELEPFKEQSHDEIVKNLVSRKWITEQLSKGWLLMRWKERCFVSPSNSRQGLTISGFYYISIRRDNGHVEGMYYDPGSSPYQQLSLDPIMQGRMVFPAYSFR